MIEDLLFDLFILVLGILPLLVPLAMLATLVLYGVEQWKTNAAKLVDNIPGLKENSDDQNETQRA